MAVTTTWGRIKTRVKEKGILWTINDFFHKMKIKRKENSIIRNNKNKVLSSGENTLLDLPTHTIQENRRRWETHDWSQGGDEWGKRVQINKGLDPEIWKDNLIKKMMLKYIKNDGIVLELGSGAGRWTEHLQKIANHLIIADISENLINMCKEKFKLVNNIDYKVINERLDFLEKNSIDYVWAYDVFTHINPSDVENYIEDLESVLKPGGCAVIHHSGEYSDYTDYTEGYHALMGKKQFASLVEKYGMKVIEQDEDLPHENGDIITVFVKQ